MEIHSAIAFEGIKPGLELRPSRIQSHASGLAADNRSPASLPEDTLELSLQARNRSDREQETSSHKSGNEKAAQESEKETGKGGKGDLKLSDEQKAEVRELQETDREVRAHEQAHKAVGGQYAGAISYEYQTGPDNRKYAVGGEVPIDSSPASTPQETIRKGMQVRAAALAPAQPSGADMAVAAKASQMIMQAQAELAEEQRVEISGDNDEDRTQEEAVKQSQFQAYEERSAGYENARGRALDAFG